LRGSWLGAALLLGVAGCNAPSGSGPWMNDASSRSTESLPFDVIDLTTTTVVAYRPAAETVTSAVNRPAPVGRVTIAAGDTIQVRVYERYPGGIFPTPQNPDAVFTNQRVSEQGTIDVLFAGPVRVAGLDLHQAEAEIARQLEDKAKEPLVIVDFVGGRSGTIMVSGEVKSPGRQSLLDGAQSVVDAINRAGGLALPLPPRPAVNESLVLNSAPSGGAPIPANEKPKTTVSAMQMEVLVRRRGSVILDKPLSDLQAGGDIGVQEGDEIVVLPRSRVITLIGAVEKSGNVPMTKSDMSLAEALGESLGLLDNRANKTGVFVFRMGDVRHNPAARGRIFKLDLYQPQSMLVAQQFGMQPNDVVFVTNAPATEYYKIITPLYRTLSLGAIARGSSTIPVTF
jgi:polysaccharide biosynthesis/export protein